MKTVAEVLREAVTVLDERGWMQGDLEDAQGHCCMVGAIRIAAHGNTSVIAPDDAAHLAHTAAQESLNQALHVWNDEPGRTVDEVKAALLAAAERAEAGA